MCILPKFLYLFQALLIRIPPHFFKQAHSIFIKLIWAHSKPCLPRHYLTLPKLHEGLALPNVKKYYLAVHLGRVIDWNRNYRDKLWMQLEQAQTDIPLKGALWCFNQLPSVTPHFVYALPLYLRLSCFPYKAIQRFSLDLECLSSRHFLKWVETEHFIFWMFFFFPLPFWNALLLHYFLHSFANPT